MKGLPGKLKDVDWKQLFVGNAEKIGLGAAVFVVLVALSMANWSTYSKTPEDFEAEASKVSNQLMKSVWPETERSKFASVDFTAEARNRVDSPLKSQPYEYLVEMSPKLYPREAQLKDVTLPPVEDVLALSGRILIETKPRDASSAFPDANPVMAEKTKGDKSKAKAPVELTDEFKVQGKDADSGTTLPGNIAPLNPMPGGLAVAPGAGGGESAVEERPSRGMRYNVVLAIVPHKKIIEAIRQALNIPYGDAANKLKYYDVKIERKKGLPGNDWSGPWEELSLEPTITKMAEEWNGAAAEIVNLNVTDNGFTMALPPRVMGNWKEHGTHPRLNEYLLTQEQADKEAEEQAKLADMADKGPKKDKRGFAVIQKDLGGVQRSVAATQSAPGNLPGMRGGMPAPIAGVPMPGVVGAPGLPGASAQPQTVANHSEMLLFRFFDLDPEPGQSYRYRTRIVIANPNLDADISRLEKPEVAQGETRETPWSEESNPVTVESDTDYFVARIPRRGGRPLAGVVMDVYQWNSSLGIIEKGALMHLNFGQNVGGRTKTTEGDFLNETATENKEVLLYAQDVFVDAEGAPTIAAADHPDLTVLSKASPRLLDGVLDEALTVQSDGSLKITSRQQSDASKPAVDRRYQAQMAAIDTFLEKSKKESANEGSLDDALDGDGKKGKGKAKRNKNPAMGAMAPVAGAPAPGGPGPAYPAGKKKNK